MGKIRTLVCVSVLLAGCGGGEKAKSYLFEPESALATATKATKIMHSSVDFPRGLTLNMPGYILGIEKSPRERVTTSRWQEIPTQHLRIPSDERRTTLLADAVYVDTKAHVITHIMEYDLQSSANNNFQRMSGCALYNLYEHDAADAKIECADHLPALKKDELTQAFDHSWAALDRFDQSLNARMTDDKPPTHIVVYVMGWNTPQIEAVRNFNSLAGHLMDAADQEAVAFRPLIIGVTWPSLWRGVPLVPSFITQPLSYRNKSNDADEIGLTWLGVLIHDYLAKYRTQAPVVVVGHSFGARATSRAVFTGPAIAKNGTASGDNYNRVADLVISLQGAYSKNRFLTKDDKGREDQPYDHFRSQAGQVLLTASSLDSAVDLGFWADAAGNEESWEDECSGTAAAQNPIFHCQNLKQKSDFLTLVRALPKKLCVKGDPASCRIQYLKLDPIIRFNAAETGGNAHSDVYRAPIGVLTWEAIKKYAPGKLGPIATDNGLRS
jgi:hypothetical protein